MCDWPRAGKRCSSRTATASWPSSGPPSPAGRARALLGRIAFLELSRTILARALEPFPTPVRTLDALHLASLDFLRDQGHAVRLACYDAGLVAAARRLKAPLLRLS